MTLIAGKYKVDVGGVIPFQVSKTDYYDDEPTELLQPIRVQDGDDATKKTVLQPGSPTEDYHVVRLEDLTSSSGRVAYALTWGGAIIVTPTGEDDVLYPYGGSGNTITVKAIMVTATKQGSSGTTDIRVSAAAKGGSTTDSIVLQLSSSNRSGYATGSFEITAFDPLYVYCEDATGGHENININIITEGGGTS